MENETYNQEEVQVEQKSQLHQVTPLSKYLALALFVVLPFLGGWIGYMYAPEKVVEREVIREVAIEESVMPEPVNSIEESKTVTQVSEWATYSSPTINFSYPQNWTLTDDQSQGTDYEVLAKIVNPAYPGVPDTDSPSEMILVRTKEDTTCDSPDTGWEKGFGPGYYRTICFDGNINSLEIMITSLGAETQSLMEEVISSIKI